MDNSSLSAMLNEKSHRPSAEVVKITPLGSKTGEFCAADRAFLLEDPTGVRILYDPGNTVAGASDKRLGAVHVALLSHVHSDHLGNAKLAVDPSASDARCDTSFAQTPTVPNSNFAEIAAANNSAVLVTGDVAALLSKKIQNVRGMPTQPCPATGLSNLIVVSLPAPCTGYMGFGAKRTVAMSADMPGVVISMVTAIHGNGLDNSFVTPPLSEDLAGNGLSVTVGPAAGYVLTFTNGLVLYLSGDTEQSADMRAIVHEYYRARLAILNIGDLFTTGPEEAASAARTLLQLAAVIPSHANEVATSGGQVLPNSRTAHFITALNGLPAFVPLSGHTLSFNGEATCVAGCSSLNGRN